jgi:O-6-methylguanine DNA methyltransferase
MAKSREPDTISSRSFSAAVLSVVRRIPTGRVATYGDVAARAGRPRASRAVGNIMRECRDSSVPCHRVVGAGGALGGYGGNLELKRSLLRAEGLIVIGQRIRSFAAVRWQGGAAPSQTRDRHERRARTGLAHRSNVRAAEPETGATDRATTAAGPTGDPAGLRPAPEPPPIGSRL